MLLVFLELQGRIIVDAKQFTVETSNKLPERIYLESDLVVRDIDYEVNGFSVILSLQDNITNNIFVKNSIETNYFFLDTYVFEGNSFVFFTSKD